MGKWGLPDAVINDKTQIIGKIAQTDISAGDFLFPQKLSEFVANKKLDRIVKDDKRLVTISVPSIAAGLSSHLQSGDIVTVAVFINQITEGRESQSNAPRVTLYPELKNLEVYTVDNARTQSTAVEKLFLSGVTATAEKPPLL